MKNAGNVITIIILSAIGLYYFGSWAYTEQYKAPRTALLASKEKLEKGIDWGEKNVAVMQKFVAENQSLYYRSFPRVPNAVQSYYPLWLTQLAEFSGFYEPEVKPSPQAMKNFGIQYNYQLTGQANMANISRFLYEFYWSPNLHKILSVNLSPIEQSDLLNIVIRIEAIALRPANIANPYPAREQFPVGYFRRLASGPFRTYSAISSRDLLQYAKGGIDKADYTFLSVITSIDDNLEIRLKDRTTEQTTTAKIGDKIEIGSFFASVAAITQDDVLFQQPNGQFWLLSIGEPLSEAYPLPSELGFIQ